MVINESEVHLWIRSFRRLGRGMDALRSLLSEDELRRADRYRRAADADRFVAGNAWLRRLLESYTEIRAQDIVFSYGAYGKPELSSGRPIPDIRFNMSHTTEMIAYVFALGQNVGVDIESNLQQCSYSDGYSRVLTPKELARMEAVAPGRRRELFLTYWTRKEACLKALGMGFSLDPQIVDVSTPPAVSIRDPRSAERHEEETVLWVTDFQVAETHTGAIAIEGLVAPKRVQHFFCDDELTLVFGTLGE